MWRRLFKKQKIKSFSYISFYLWHIMVLFVCYLVSHVLGHEHSCRVSLDLPGAGSRPAHACAQPAVRGGRWQQSLGGDRALGNWGPVVGGRLVVRWYPKSQHMFHCSGKLQLHTTNSKIKVLRTERWWLRSTKRQLRTPFLSTGPTAVHLCIWPSLYLYVGRTQHMLGKLIYLVTM